MKSGIKPAAIDSLGSLANIGKLDACGIDSLHHIENRFLHQILAANPQEAFIVEEVTGFTWNPVLSSSFLKTDIVNKNLKNCLPGKN